MSDTKNIKDLEYQLTGLTAHIADRGRALYESVFHNNRMIRANLDIKELDRLEEMIQEYRETSEERQRIIGIKRY